MEPANECLSQIFEVSPELSDSHRSKQTVGDNSVSSTSGLGKLGIAESKGTSLVKNMDMELVIRTVKQIPLNTQPQ